MSDKMIDAKTLAEKWGVSTRRIGQLCNDGVIDGAIKVQNHWEIPADTKIPEIMRTKINFSSKTKLLPCPVGITSFKEVSSECYYVDKTLMIKDIIDSHNKVTLFTRPRRFGKTLTMDMIKTYFEKTDEDTSIYFMNHNIWKCDDSYKTYQSQYPVIFITFKDAHQNTWSDMYESICLSLQSEFIRHIKILENKNIPDIDKDFFKRMLNNEISTVECQTSLGKLSSMLFNAYKSKVIVIIDEYDTPIQEGYTNGYYNEVTSFMRNLFSSVLKDNSFLEFGILTGILRIAKESLFSGLNNLTIDTILDEKYSNYFGFTKNEVHNIAKYYNQTKKIDELSEWYDGYLFGNTEIYNPWSVINYFNNNCTPKAFWSRTSSNNMILDIIKDNKPEIQESLIELLQDNPIKSLIDTDIVYPEISSSSDTIYSFLFMTGYLKNQSIVSTINDNPICNLLIPNKEIKSIFKKEIIDNLTKNINQSIIKNFQIAIKTNNRDSLEEILRNYLLESTSNFDTSHENFYHGMMLGLLAIMSEDYYIESNKESGNGRFDIELRPREKNMPGIIMEFKASKENISEEKLTELAENAIDQIKNKEYAANLKSNGITDIKLYGVAFSKKKATIKIEQFKE